MNTLRMIYFYARIRMFNDPSHKHMIAEIEFIDGYVCHKDLTNFLSILK